MYIVKRIGILIGLAFLYASQIAAQPDSAGLLAGEWKGSSICQQKNSPCNDERVVYHINSTRNNQEYSIVMNKIVNGVEEVMGTLLFVFDPITHELLSTPAPDQIWRFRLFERKLDGTLYYKGVLSRIISVKKTG